MAEYAEGEGGHTWNPSLNACDACHATADFDYGGVQTEVHAQLEELRDLLLAAHVLHADTTTTPTSYHPVVGTYPMLHAQSFFNWVGLEEDRSLGVHNPKYVDALLKNSIAAMGTH